MASASGGGGFGAGYRDTLTASLALIRERYTPERKPGAAAEA